MESRVEEDFIHIQNSNPDNVEALSKRVVGLGESVVSYEDEVKYSNNTFLKKTKRHRLLNSRWTNLLLHLLFELQQRCRFEELNNGRGQQFVTNMLVMWFVCYDFMTDCLNKLFLIYISWFSRDDSKYKQPCTGVRLRDRLRWRAMFLVGNISPRLSSLVLVLICFCLL